jgi:aspartate/methionine/tyrosine aminotransferase
MNRLADELNRVLDGTVIARALSGFGRRMYFPKGIVAQTAEAKARAGAINATVGMALEAGAPLVTPSLAAMVNHLTAEEMVGYAPTAGIPELRELWLAELRRKNPSLGETATSLPVVTSGLTNGIFQVAELFADAGETVIVPDLHWGNYRLIFEQRRGADVVTFPLGDTGALTATLRGRAKAIVLLNTPNNPTGYSPTVTEAQEITSALMAAAEDGTDLIVVSDDAYFGLFYEPGTFTESMFSLLAGAHERILAVKVDGATKEEFAWGMRVGFLTFAGRGLAAQHYEALIRKLMGSIRSSISSCSRIAQSMLVRLLQDPNYEKEKQAFRDILEERYRVVRQRLAEPLGPLVPLPFNSGYFLTFDCGAVDAEKLRMALLDRGIGTVSIGPRYLRVAYSTVDREDLAQLFDTIEETARAM